VYLAAKGREGEIVANGVFEFVIMLDSDEFTIVSQSFRQAKRRIAGKGAEFEYPFRTKHFANESKYSSLHLSGEHVRIKHVHVREVCNLRQSIIFRRRMGLYILFK